jgi:outer membrane protein assembly factor BamB
VKRILLLAGIIVLILAGIFGALVVVKLRQPPDVRGSSTAEFVTTAEAVPQQPAEPGILWPTYGYSPNRLRVGPGKHQPPFQTVWRFRARQLLEFPPAIAYGRLYFANAHGTVFAISAKTGKRAWSRKTGRCQASSPAVDRHVVFFTFLRGCSGNARSNDGLLIAYAVGTGQVRWQRRIGQSESSPIVYHGRVYVGDWTGTVSAFVARSGKLAWTFGSGGKVKSAIAISGNRLFFGSYDHHVYALNLGTGKLVWRGTAQDRGFLSRGTFYGGPAVAYGRVYIGSTDGKVYSFGATSGTVRWVTGTGNYVYSSPAVWEQRVYAGSYDGQLYCFDAATGAVEWRFKANGKISGSPTIVDGIVYFATLAGRTYGVDAKSGKQVWTFPDGEYTPVVSDADRLYLVGRARIYALKDKLSVAAQRGRRKRSPAATGRPASRAPTRS